MSLPDLRWAENHLVSVLFFDPRKFGALILVGKSSKFVESPEIIFIKWIFGPFTKKYFFVMLGHIKVQEFLEKTAIPGFFLA